MLPVYRNRDRWTGARCCSKFPARVYVHNERTIGFENEQEKLEAQKKAACIIGKDYPKPIVQHAVQRDRFLSFFNKGKTAK